jgi:hypothetical protein
MRWHNRAVMRQEIWEDWPDIILHWLFFIGLGSLRQWPRGSD